MEENPQFAHAIAALTESDEGCDAGQALLDAAWAKPGDPRLVIVENAEALSTNPALIACVAKLAASGHERRTIICSRISIGMGLFRRLAPAELLQIGMRDLEFTKAETSRLLAIAGANERQIRAGIAVAAGWPIAALLFARAAFEGNVDEIISHAGEADDLNSYVVSQAFGDMDLDTLEFLGAIALLGSPTAEELRVLGVCADEVVRRSRYHSFFIADAKTVIVHPLARSALQHAGAGHITLSRCAAAIEDRDPLMAARFLVCAGIWTVQRAYWEALSRRT